MAHITFSEGSGLNDSIYGKSQAPLRMLIESRAEAFEEKSILNEVFMMDESKHWAEKYSTLTAMDGFDPVGENGAYPVDGMEEGYYIISVTYKGEENECYVPMNLAIYPSDSNP